MSYATQVPEITAAAATPNPVTQSTALLISVTITEKTITLEPYYFYSGDRYAGEV